MMTDSFILMLFTIGLCLVFILGGLGMALGICITKGLKAAIEFIKREW